MEDKVLLIAACHRIIAVTQVLLDTLQTKHLVIHKPQSNKNKLRIVATTTLLAVGTSNLIKSGYRVFLSSGKSVGA
jgi:hypothetical protein